MSRLTTITTSLESDTTELQFSICDVSESVDACTDRNDDVIKPTAEAVMLAITLGVVITLTVVGNAIVCATIVLNRKLHTVTNYFLLSLATTDLLLGVCVMPLSAVATVGGRHWPLGPVVCNVYTSGDVMLCTVSILTLFAISLDRYAAVTSPLWYQTTINCRLVWKLNAAIWAFSAIMAFVPIHLGWNTVDGRIQNYYYDIVSSNRTISDPPSCVLEVNRTYALLVAMGTYFGPLIVMAIVYFRVLHITRWQVKQINRYCIASVNYNHALDESDSHYDSIAYLPVVSSATSGATRHVEAAASIDQAQLDIALDHGNTENCQRNRQLAIVESSKAMDSERRKHVAHGRTTIATATVHRCKSSNNSSRHPVVTDRKAIVVLASVLVAFAVCWIPYFVLFTVRPFLTPSSTSFPATFTSDNNSSTTSIYPSSSYLMHYETTRRADNESYDVRGVVDSSSSKTVGSHKPEIPVVLDEFCLWLGYVNSFINPFLYAFYNSAFRRGMRRLVVCKRQL